ncbi:EF-hand calcium-binding domain-containing protein 7 isoform X2 [Aplysia californica]|uniref:EF-hand calcium-binding domain-containing protein 7 isoform X2 n=1 Tax=Aplysia californica TaxID=6500 RepID=A0ABM1A6G2_APLCA|nr:EF-hand calcium-binding domain-containing protein 7 isoform X2 [Aplysia californica]
MSSQRRSSRPSSAASRTSMSAQSDVETKLECRAAFLGRYDDIRDEIDSKDDLMTLLQQTGRNPSSRVISKYWTRNTESLTFDDFVDICRREPVTSEDELMRAFRKIDVNGDGYISLDELFKVMTTKGEKMSRSEVKAMIDEVDENKDGRLDYKEFSHMVISTAEDYKKMSIRMMEKKEKRKLKKKDGEVTPRRERDDTSLGSQLSVRSSASDKLTSPRQRSSLTHPEMNAQNRKSSRQSVAAEVFHNAGRRPSKHSITSEAANVSLPRSESRQSLLSHDMDDEDLSKGRRESRPRSAGRAGRGQEPNNIRDWTGVSSKGAFFLDDESGMVTHSYSLVLSEDTEVWITIQPLRIGESGESLDGTVIDTALFVLNADDNSLVAFTENRDSKGKYSLRCSLSMGTYTLIPFTTGCRLKPRRDTSTKDAKLITKDKEGKIALTRAFRKALEEIFEMADLDGNGLLSRDEFNWYNLRTSGEEIADDEWQVVEDNIDLEKGEITRTGFLRLNEMEADDNEGDTEDLWITLNGMGFNKSLILDEACPFLLRVYAEACDDPELTVTGLDANKEKINEAVCELAISKGEPSKVRGMKDLTMYTYSNDHRAMIVVDNKSKTRVKIELDCSKRRGLVSHTGSLVAAVTASPQTAVVGHHILPLDDRGDFSVVCEESILK